MNYCYALLLKHNFIFCRTTVNKSHVDIIDTFVIDSDVLKIGTGHGNINFETSDVIAVLIESVDSGSPAYSVQSTILLQIQDVNDPPTDITLTAQTVSVTKVM